MSEVISSVVDHVGCGVEALWIWQSVSVILCCAISYVVSVVWPLEFGSGPGTVSIVDGVVRSE